MPSPRPFVLLFLFTVMEMLAGYTVVVGTSLLDATTVGYAVFWFLLVVALAGLVAGLVTSSLHLGQKTYGALLVVTGIVVCATCTVLIASNVVAGLVTGMMLGVAFWRGLVAASAAPEFDEVQHRFGFGFAAIFFGIVWVLARGILHERAIWYMLAIVGISYTLAALFALALARLAGTREQGAGSAVGLAIGLQLLFIALLAFGALQIFSLDVIGGFMHLTQGFWDALGSAAHRVILLVAGPIQALFDLLRPKPHSQQIVRLAPPQLGGAPSHAPKPKKPESSPIVTGLAIAFIACVFTGIAFLIWKAVPHRATTSPNRGFTEARTSLATPGELIRAVLQWLRGLMGRGIATIGGAGTTVRRRITGPDYPSDPVRRMYAQMLYHAQRSGCPRTPATTPAEYGVALAMHWPAARDDISLLTSAYVERRYGEGPVAPEAMSSLRVAWGAIRTVMRVAPEGIEIPQQAQSAVMDADQFTWSWLAATMGVSAVGAIVPVLVAVFVIGALIGAAEVLGKHGTTAPVPAYFAPSLQLGAGPHGSVLALQSNDNRLLALSPTGVLGTAHAIPGLRSGRFNAAEGFALDAQGNLYVADTGHNRVLRFSPSGSLTAQYGGSAYGLLHPWGIAVAASGGVYVSDAGHSRVVEISPRGGRIRWIGTRGTGHGQFTTPYGIALDRNDNLYVTDGPAHRVEVFDSQGRFVADWPVSDPPSTASDVPGPTGIALGANGRIYVSDSETTAVRFTVQEFSPAGRLLTTWGTDGSPLRLNSPSSVTITSSGKIFIYASGTGHLVQVSPRGPVLHSFTLSGGVKP